MRSAFLAAVLALGTGAPLRAGVEVRGAADRLDVSAVGAPISEVLDSLARMTRMKVLYEGVTPRMLVTIELRGRTPAQAVLGVLEGLGLNYALQLDSTGAQVETLMIVGGAAGGTGGTGAAGATSALRPPSRPEPRAPEPSDVAQPDETDQRAESAAGGEPHDVPKEPPAKKPPTPIAPLNPVNPFSSSPFGPPPQPVQLPSPSPSSSPTPPPPAP